MKNGIGAVLVFCAAVSFAAGCASGGGASRFEQDSWWYQGEAVVRQVEGQVEFSRNGAEWSNARRGLKLEEGDRLRTGAASEALLDLGETTGGVVRVMPESVVILEQLSPVDEKSEVAVILNLPTGRVLGDTLKLPAPKNILVKTPNGTHVIEASDQ